MCGAPKKLSAEAELCPASQARYICLKLSPNVSHLGVDYL